MKVSKLLCPACGSPFPEGTRSNQLVACPACGSTLFMSDWEIGKTQGAASVATPTRVYTVTDLLGKDDLCHIYRCTYKADDRQWQGIFRIARSPQDNDLVQAEANVLYHFQSTTNYDDFRPFLPQVLESFLYRDRSLSAPHQVNILSPHQQIASPGELYSFEEVREHYRFGVDPKDMAWMWRRLLYILGFAHQSGVVHGAVLPLHVLIEPHDHKLALSGWGFSVRDAQSTGKRLRAMSMSYESWYPPEVAQRSTATPGLDLYLAAPVYALSRRRGLR